ncbi:hypothetical protein DES39_2035 [Orbus hercynius]|uniref:DUF4136 domain-containing protein n=1 Tax=Orbus hercynius TaxID=593135 RepID=A0A495RCS6_9GAMM|nr:hypothetical protein [Orbus hercynius]RKS84818.1 hypothetical protein DES39_2035 [Orbus hercynius]
MSKWQKIIMLFSLFLLVGCENADIKKTLQAGFDNANPTGTRGVCFTVGRIDYPYTTKEVTGKLDEYGYNRFIDGNNILNKRLAMFARLGLLSETAAVDDNGQPTGFYQYNFTDEGLKYKAYYLGGTSQVFCFGRVVVDSIGNKLWEPNKTTMTFTYYYHVEGEIPEWAKSPELNEYIALSKDNQQIDWSDQGSNNFFRKTKEGLKPIVTVGSLVFGN